MAKENVLHAQKDLLYVSLINTKKIQEHTVHVLKILGEWFETFLVEVGVALSKVATEFCCSFMEAEGKKA